MYSGVSGLRSHQTKMDVIGNNIANVNTTGFKASSVTFQDVYSQTTEAASAPSEDGNIGGKNAMQVGLGVSVAAINIDTKAGNPQSTESSLDVSINGDGYFVLRDNTGADVYTRVGNFKLDAEGNLVHAGTGYFVTSVDEDIITNSDNLTNVAIDQQGIVKGLDEEGNEVEIAQIRLVNFMNNAGLEKIGSSMYQVTSNSGEPLENDDQVPGNNGTGLLAPGYLEMSNVDLAKEFTEMITTQRGYQANSRVITTSDTMLEELINLKR
jgi:flagellar hook protein FlgE